MMRQPTSLILAVLLCAGPAMPAGAVFEDLPAGARQLGFGGRQAALEDSLGFYANPALAGSARKFGSGGHFLSSDRTTQGQEDVKAYGAWALVPRMAYGKMGTLSLGGVYGNYGGELKQKEISIGWGTWHLLRLESGVLDFGVNFKMLSASVSGGEESASGFAVDLGALFRPDDRHTVGLSILNLNNPAFSAGAADDNAPRVLRLGVSERREDFTLSADLAMRSASSGEHGNVSFNPGVEHVWRTERAGRLFSRAGLNLAERATALSAGVGWRRLSTELSYSAAVPLTGGISAAHSLTFSLRFGDRDLESDYERMMRQEIKYRRDLVEALDEAAFREARLKDELTQMKDEIDELSARLRSTRAQEDTERIEKERLEAVVRRQRAAEAELKALAAKRKANKLNQLRHDFKADWKAYVKLKSGGAPGDVLKGSLQRMISQYQDSGIDISQATLELRQLVSGE